MHTAPSPPRPIGFPRQRSPTVQGCLRVASPPAPGVLRNGPAAAAHTVAAVSVPAPLPWARPWLCPICCFPLLPRAATLSSEALPISPALSAFPGEWGTPLLLHSVLSLITLSLNRVPSPGRREHLAPPPRARPGLGSLAPPSA